ncbi:MAG: alpha-amylase, partial [Chloroflexi bacterium]|nr:alpha-amylase [Chloroflexota bacterium]
MATSIVVEAGSGIPLPEPALSVQNSGLISDIPQVNLELAAQDWWRDAVFYEIFVRSFYDSDCDGIGDFNGITQKLDYLQALGVNAIWLMPIHPSPSYHGYDVLNYYAVNHEYGSMDDFQRLLDEIHRREMHLIVDLVLNHTSSAHPFFVDANNNPNSPYRDWYIWSDTDPGNGWHQGAQGYYYGFFWSGMPDLNYTNPEVTAQMNNVVRYWLDDIGVDGFRIDAAKHLIEDGDQRENTPATHDWYKKFYAVYKTDHPNAYTVGEVYGAGGFIAQTYTDQLDHVFNFELASGFVNSANGRSNTGINSAYTLTLKNMLEGNFATFLTNHDQNRTMSVFNGDLGKAKTAASLLLTAPGTPFIYYGEEIGMQGKKPDEDIRLPMQWSADQQAGFSCPLA